MVTLYMIIMYYFEPDSRCYCSLWINTFDGVDPTSFGDLNGGHLLKHV